MYEFLRLHERLMEQWREVQRSYDESVETWSTPGRLMFYHDRWFSLEVDMGKFLEALHDLRASLTTADRFLEDANARR
jgi:hypothetical protein